MSLESDLTITPERFRGEAPRGDVPEAAAADVNSGGDDASGKASEKPSQLAGYVGLFTGCGALVALSLFLPLPARFGEVEGVTPAEAVTDSFYVVGAVAFVVAVFVFVGLRNLNGEDGKGWRVLLGLKGQDASSEHDGRPSSEKQKVLPYLRLLRESVTLGFTDSQIALGYLGGFVARASTVAISLFIPLFVNTYFMDNGFCQGSPNDPSPELKKECRAAYILASILTGVAQLFGLVCAPIFGYVSRRPGTVNYPIIFATLSGILGYMILPRLASPEFKDKDGRGGSPVVFFVVALLGISQIGAIVCSLGSLGRGVLAADLPGERSQQQQQERGQQNQQIRTVEEEVLTVDGVQENGNGNGNGDRESAPLLHPDTQQRNADATTSRVRLKGSIAGVYSWCGGAAILLLTKLGGYLFDSLSHGAPFYMMALFNGILLAASLGIDMTRAFGGRARSRSRSRSRA